MRSCVEMTVPTTPPKRAAINAIDQSGTTERLFAVPDA
jgi:hypothetical protein